MMRQAQITNHPLKIIPSQNATTTREANTYDNGSVQDVGKKDSEDGVIVCMCIFYAIQYFVIAEIAHFTKPIN